MTIGNDLRRVNLHCVYAQINRLVRTLALL